MFGFRYAASAFSIKTLVTVFLIFVGIGYVFGLINIYNQTGMSYTGLVVHYRGAEGEEVPPEFAASKLVHEHHVHLFSLTMLFFLVGLVFSFTSLPEIIKAPCIAAPFLGMFLDFTSFWLVVFSSPVFAWTAIAFGSFMGLSFFMLIGRPLYEMWVLPVLEKKCGDKLPRFFK